MNKPKILCLKHKDSAVFTYRMDRPLVEGLGANVRKSIIRKNDMCTVKELSERFKRHGDIWVIKYIDDFYSLNVLHSIKNAAKAKIVLDIDDNMWQIPEGNIARGDIRAHVNRSVMLTESVIAADWVTVSTVPLKLLLKGLNPNVAVLPNYINENDWKHKRKRHKKIRIGWVWSPTHIPDNNEVEGVLDDIQKKYGDKIEIVIFGTNKNIFDFDTVNIPAVSHDKYPKMFREAGIDISIGALADNEFNRCKSNIKWLESTMAGAVFIGSNVYPYAHSVKHCKTGFIAKTRNQWVKYISWMIENKDRRNEIVKEARKEVLRLNKESEKKWKDFYKYLAVEK